MRTTPVVLPIIETILDRSQSGDCRNLGDLDIGLLRLGRWLAFEAARDMLERAWEKHIM
jgi:hypothetical protein